MKITTFTKISMLIGLLSIAGCAHPEQAPQSDYVRVEGVVVSLGGMTTDGDSPTRAVDDFAVNTVFDPTNSFSPRTGWNFDFQIYKGSVQFVPYGTAEMVWDPGTSRWVADGSTLFFPNYERQRVTIEIYPDQPDALPAADQSTAELLLLQDLLAQNQLNYRINPAHILNNIPVSHRYSMIDFMLHEVNIDQVANVEVLAGGVTYTPYKIPVTAGFTGNEYLVILPLGVSNPEIVLSTVGGARYREILEITTAENICFCIDLLGLELRLGGVTVSDWSYGQALSGDYSIVTSYPTFKGPANTSATLLYDNGLDQLLTFNSRGEFTTKPTGRTILQINGTELPSPIVLRSMIIDLNPYLSGN